MKVGNIRAQREAGDFRVVPVDRKGDGRIAQNTEVESVVGVFPNVVAAEDKVLAESLLEAGMKLVAKTRLQRCRTRRANKSSGASTAFEHPWLESTRFSLKGVSRVRA